MIVIALATCLTAWWMFYRILEDHTGRTQLAFTGMLLYVLLPYHVNLIRQNVSRTQMAVWMLIPLVVAMLTYMKRTAAWPVKLGAGIAAAAGVGIIGRKDVIAYLILLFLLVVAGICEKRWEYPAVGIAGILPAFPAIAVWKHWLFDGAFAESGLEYTSIMKRGYSIGGLFSTFFYRGGNPGMGIGLMAVLLILCYAAAVKKIHLMQREDYFWLGTAGFFTLLSLRYFPWDFVQRLGTWALGLVSLLQTPAVFFGYAQIILCVWSVKKCSKLLKLRTEITGNQEKIL